MKKKQKNNTEKRVFICFLMASVCFYVSAIIGVFFKDGSHWIVHLCLGSTFLCLSTIYLNKGEDNNNEDK